MQIRIDNTIIEKINNGDEKAFSTLYEAYYLYLNATAFYYINNKSVSREIVNDVFLHIWMKRETLSFPIHTYLIKAVQNGCIDHLRAQSTRKQALNNHKEKLTFSYQECYIRATPEPLQYVELRETEEQIKKALSLLPLRCQQIFTAYFYDGKSADQIAEDMGISISTVRVQLKNSFDRLKKLLEHLLFFFF